MPKYIVEVVVFSQKFFDNLPANSPQAAEEAAKVILGSLCNFSGEKFAKTEVVSRTTSLASGWGYPVVALWSAILPVEIDTYDAEWAKKKTEMDMLDWCIKRNGPTYLHYKINGVSEKKDSARRR